MARTVERRRTTTRRTSRVEGADEIKSNLTNVASEIARVRDSARQEVDALEKIRGMLDTGYLNGLIASIEGLETRIEELESATLHAQDEVDRYQADLGEEQERLKKLWDAYKTQEDELDRIKRDYPLMEEKLFERERTIETLRREIARLEPLGKFKDDYEALSRDHRALEGEADRLDRELEKANNTITKLEQEVDSLAALEDNAGRAEELERALEEERERLAKLYKVYEDLEADKKAADAELESWHAWFSTTSKHMSGICNSLDSAPQ